MLETVKNLGEIYLKSLVSNLKSFLKNSFWKKFFISSVGENAEKSLLDEWKESFKVWKLLAIIMDIFD